MIDNRINDERTNLTPMKYYSAWFLVYKLPRDNLEILWLQILLQMNMNILLQMKMKQFTIMQNFNFRDFLKDGK